MDSDDKLIEAARGEDSAFEVLVRRHYEKTFGLCWSLLHDHAAAQDATQEIFIKVYRRLESFQKNASFSTWLYRVAANHCLDILRKNRRERREPLETFLDREAAATPQAAASLETSDLIEKALNRLSPQERLILTLREAQGLSYEEIAQTLECSLDAVKARLKRARQGLKEEARHFLEPGSVS